jgi:hypothetical protein
MQRKSGSRLRLCDSASTKSLPRFSSRQEGSHPRITKDLSRFSDQGVLHIRRSSSGGVYPGSSHSFTQQHLEQSTSSAQSSFPTTVPRPEEERSQTERHELFSIAVSDTAAHDNNAEDAPQFATALFASSINASECTKDQSLGGDHKRTTTMGVSQSVAIQFAPTDGIILTIHSFIEEERRRHFCFLAKHSHRYMRFQDLLVLSRHLRNVSARQKVTSRTIYSSRLVHFQ